MKKFKIGQEVTFKSIEPYTCSTMPISEIKGKIVNASDRRVDVDIFNCPSFEQGYIYYFWPEHFKNIKTKPFWRFWQ